MPPRSESTEPLTGDPFAAPAETQPEASQSAAEGGSQPEVNASTEDAPARETQQASSADVGAISGADLGFGSELKEPGAGPSTPPIVVVIPRRRVFGDTLTEISNQKERALTQKSQLQEALAATEQQLNDLAELELITEDPEAIRAVELGAKLGISLR